MYVGAAGLRWILRLIIVLKADNIANIDNIEISIWCLLITPSAFLNFGYQFFEKWLKSYFGGDYHIRLGKH